MTSLVQRISGRLRRFDEHVVRADATRAATSLIVAVAVLFVPIFSAWQVARAAATATRPIESPVATPVQLLEPVFSVRRVARTLAIESRVAGVQRELAKVARSLPAESCLVATGEGRVLAEVNGERPLVPASNMKLLTAVGALEVLGPDHRFETVLRGERVGGNIIGNLWLVGGGDPLLSTRGYPETQRYSTLSPSYLDALADEVAASGVTIVTGSVVGDESRYDQERYVPTWGDGIRAVEGGPLGALMVDDGNVIGQPIKPANPALSAATVFTRLLAARGVNVLRDPQVGTAPSDAPVIARLTSASLQAIFVDLLANSDNNAAELLVKELGLVANGSPTRVAGLQAIADALEARGLPVAGLVLADGSGLDGGNRVTCTLLGELLKRYGLDSPIGRALALAGTTGTLQDVFTSGPAARMVRAKTGTLRSAKTLSGFFPAGNDTLTFVIMMNGNGVSNQSVFLPAWNQMMRALSLYDDEPSEAALAPRG
jgi:D-alanyl-D-alanine carboxypeptidase/D-alanyl-D-alanine-endopeptidase (penicillin-binding protein 4)